MAQPIHTRMTWSDYQQLPEDGNRYEVLEGTLMMSPAPGFRHQCVSMNLSYLVERWRRDSGAGGRVLTAPFDVVLSDDVILQPDLVYISESNMAAIAGERLCGAPDLAVEIFRAAGAARDRVAKLQLYAKFGVREYWLVDLDARALTILVLTEDHFEQLASGTGATVLRSQVLTGLKITGREVFEGI